MKQGHQVRQLFRFLNTNKHLVLIVIVAIAVLALSVDYNFGRFSNMGTFKYDTGNMTQLLHNSLNGRLLQFTDYNGENVFRFSEHVDPTILLVLPFYFLWQSPKTLLFIQSLLLICAIIPLYKVSLIKLKNKWLSTLVVLTFLVSPVIGNLLVTDFHAVSFCVLFILLAYLSLLLKKNVLYLIFFILAILSKENVALSFIPFAFVIYFHYKNKKMGLITLLVSVLYSYLAIAVLIPYFRGAEASVHASFDLAYGYLGSSYSNVFSNLILNPVNTFNILTEPDRLKYFTHTLYLYGFLPLFAFPYSLLILPEFLLKGFSSIGSMRNFNYQYTAIITPFLFIATINYVKKFSRYIKFQYLLLGLIFLFNLNYSLTLNNITLQFFTNSFNTVKSKESDVNVQNLLQPRFTSTPYNIVGLIPEGESVSAPNFMGAHLAQRQYLAMYPAKFDQFQNVIVEYNQTTLPSIVFSLYKRNTFLDNRKNVASILTNKNYKLVLAENGLAYFKKVKNGGYKIPVVDITETEKNALSDNVLVTKPKLEIFDKQSYLVTNINYRESSDNIIIYTLKTISRQFQVIDLYRYAELNRKLEDSSVISVFLTNKELENPIEVTVSEHSLDENLTIKSSTNLIKFDNINKDINL